MNERRDYPLPPDPGEYRRDEIAGEPEAHYHRDTLWAEPSGTKATLSPAAELTGEELRAAQDLVERLHRRDAHLS